MGWGWGWWANDASARSGRVQRGSKVNTVNNKEKMVDVLRNVDMVDTNNRKFSKSL